MLARVDLHHGQPLHGHTGPAIPTGHTLAGPHPSHIRGPDGAYRPVHERDAVGVALALEVMPFHPPGKPAPLAGSHDIHDVSPRERLDRDLLTDGKRLPRCGHELPNDPPGRGFR